MTFKEIFVAIDREKIGEYFKDLDRYWVMGSAILSITSFGSAGKEVITGALASVVGYLETADRLDSQQFDTIRALVRQCKK